ADAALLLWIDAETEHWACVLRRSGLPKWERLRGSGKGGVWTVEDDRLPTRLYEALTKEKSVPPAERERLAEALARQRIGPIREPLGAGGGLPAIRHLLVVPTGVMARVPVELLGGPWQVSYIPSGSLYALLAEQRRPLQASSLLAVGDPVFTAAP